MRIAILKTGALGDVLRTTSILPGLRGRAAREGRELEVVWVTAPAARDLVRLHPLVDRVELLDPRDAAAWKELGEKLQGASFERVLSFDDEEAVCRLATWLDAGRGTVSGAFADPDSGRLAYTEDCAPWFEMGLLSVHGKEEADRRKKDNRESHPAIFARMLGVSIGEPELPLPDNNVMSAADFARRMDLHARGPVIGLNTGAGGRWESKRLPEERVVALVGELHARLNGEVSFLLLGGPEEGERNARIQAGVATDVLLVDAGTRNTLLDFAALVGRLDLLVTSDSLALHIGVSQRVPLVAFFAPTPAAEIELYGRGVKVESTAPDYASYRRDADTSTLTVERLSEAILLVLAQARGGAPA